MPKPPFTSHTEHEGYYYLGSIVRTHGVKGNVIIRLEVDQPAAYKKLKAAFLDINGTLKPVNISPGSISGDQMILHIEGVDDMDAAAQLARIAVFLPLKDLPPLKGKKIYLHEAIGMRAVDAVEGELGVISKIYDLPEQPVASVDFHGKELLFPVITEFIDRIDRENKILYLRLPEGLVEIYR